MGAAGEPTPTAPGRKELSVASKLPVLRSALDEVADPADSTLQQKHTGDPLPSTASDCSHRAVTPEVWGNCDASVNQVKVSGI